jgi:predicted CXXCH cytochrome family protein
MRRSRVRIIEEPRALYLLSACALAAALLCCFLTPEARVLADSSSADADAVCRSCHQQIYDRYQQTPMARASGDASAGLLPGEFRHAASGIEYRLFLKNGKAWLSYDRQDPSPDRALHGEQQLIYFIGSGNRGRTYLFERDGFWFESPVNWYSRKQLWDMNPKSLDAKEMPFTLPVDSTCLHCHTSGAQPSLPGARNHFAAAPFAHGGITCESCHGDPAAHLAQEGHGPILNPASLPAVQRVSVCLQCHLEGEIAVNQPGRSLQMFKPGDDLSEDVLFFVHQGEVGAGGRATSQWEALLQSACYRKSSGRLTCTSCHDPHGDPAPAQRAAYYRAKCLTCHSAPAFATQHHPGQQDCTTCHMAREKTENVAHEQVTDHFIRKRTSSGPGTITTQTDTLTAIGAGPVSDRDLGLAYAQLALGGDANAAIQARSLLQKAESQEKSESQEKAASRERETGTPDSDLHTELGFLELSGGNPSAAAKEDQAALSADPLNSIAAADLAVLEARAHSIDEAIRLWKPVAENDPGHTAAGYNLAIGECMQGDTGSAIQALLRVIAFSPDDAKARHLLAELQASPQACASRR